MRVENEEIKFHIFKALKYLIENLEYMKISTIQNDSQELSVEGCPLSIKLQHKVLNFDLKKVGVKRTLQPEELDIFRLEANENSRLYKERTKRWHDMQFNHREFTPGQRVLLYNSHLKLFLSKHKYRWSGSFQLHEIYKMVTPFFNLGRFPISALVIVIAHMCAYSTMQYPISSSHGKVKTRE